MFFFLDDKRARMCCFNLPLNNPSDFKDAVIFLDLQIKWNVRERGMKKKMELAGMFNPNYYGKNYFVLDKLG